MPVVRLAHPKPGATDGVTLTSRIPVDYSADTLVTLREKVVEKLGLSCAAKDVVLSLSNAAVRDTPFSELGADADEGDGGGKTLKELGLRNGAILFGNFPPEAAAAPPEAESGDSAAAGGGGASSRRAVHSFAELKRDALERHVVLLDLVLENGETRYNYEVPEDCTLSELCSRVATSVGAGSVSLMEEEDDSSGPKWSKMFAKLVGDGFGPELSGDRRVGVRVKVNVEESLAPQRVSWGGGGGAAESKADDLEEEVEAAARVEAEKVEVDEASGGMRLPGDVRPPAHVRTQAQLVEWMERNFPTLRLQPQGAVRNISICMDSFLQQHLQKRRMGWLYGKVIPAADGTPERVVVELIYEPPQLGFKERFLLLEDDREGWTEAITGRLGLERVGWVLSCPFRGERPQDILSATEVLFAARQQALHPHFVTVLFMFDSIPTPEREDAPRFGERGGGTRESAAERPRVFRSSQAFQISEQGVKLVREGDLEARAEDDPFVLRSRRKVYATDPDAPSSAVRLTERFHASYLISPVGIVARNPADLFLSFRVPPATRRGADGELQARSLESIAKVVFRAPSSRDAGTMRMASTGEMAGAAPPSLRETMLDRVSDFELLLFLATERAEFRHDATIGDDEILELCDAVRTQDGDAAATFRFKLLAALGEGFLDPIAEISGIEDIRDTLPSFVQHVHRVHRDNNELVVNPVRSARSTTKSERVRQVRGLWEDLQELPDVREISRAARAEQGPPGLHELRFGGAALYDPY